MKLVASLLIASITGITIAYIDTRPHWDDTGISMFLILMSGTICGFLLPQKPWIIALAVGISIPMFNIILHNNFESLLALGPAFAGSYVSYLIKAKIINR